MAARPTTKPSVGSITWIANERATIQQLGEQDAEDFTFAARNDLEWLNEHMADIFERNHVDMAELLKTPGRLRGQKTPRTGRKQIRPGQGREPLANIDFNQPANDSTVDNPFFTDYAVSSLPSNKQMSPARGSSKSPARSLRVLQDSEGKKLTGPVKDSATAMGQADAGQLSATDSGVWSDFQSQQIQQAELPSQLTSAISEITSDNRAGERSSTYRTTLEDSSDLPHPQSPAQARGVVSSSPEMKALEEPESIQQPPAKSVTPPKKAAKKSVPEPRRSGRLAANSSIQTQSVPPSSPPNVPHQETLAEKEKVFTLPTTQPTISSPAPARPTRSQTPTHSPEQVIESPENSPDAQTPEVEGSSPSRSSSESPAPEVPIVRKSILNFASLPAREPLTSKKKSLGVKHTRDSHVEQVRLNGANRASWMNRKGNGKSLGASSKQIEQAEKEDEQVEEIEKGEETILEPEAPKSLKRKSETVRDGSRKKSRGNTEELEGEDSNGETSKAVALHNKTSTQRLHDKIQQLGKLNASREARSFPSAVSQNSSLTYPDLPQAEQDPVASKRTESDSQGQPPSAAAVGRWTSQADDEEDWIPMKTEPKPALTRSLTEAIIDSRKGPDPEKPVSARWNHSPKGVVASQAVPVRTMTTSESVPNLRSPTAIRHLPPSPLKASFSEDWIKVPTSPPAKTPGEGAISAVKAHTSSVFKKAKEMLLKSSVSSASAKIETMNPALRTWQSGPSLREQSNGGTSPRSPKELAKQTGQLYPDLGSVLAEVGGKPSSIKSSPVGSFGTRTPKESEKPEAATEFIGESWQTKSPRFRDARDNSPEVEQHTIKVQKKNKAAEREDREEKLREREEKLRQAEEELRLAREEQRKEREQQERKHKEEQLWKQQEELLRQAEEELRQAKEQQRRHQEEQRLKDREESKRRQEERLKQQKEELKRRQQEEIRREQEAKKAKEILSSFQDEEDFTDKGEEDAAEAEIRTRITSSTEPERPPSRLQKAGSKFQKTQDTKPPQRPGTASKGAPVSISVGTASQREMQSQRSKPQLPSTSTLVAALKQSFENPSLVNSSSQLSLNSNASTNSLRSSNLGGPSKPLKSLAAAASQLKKEREEGERKAAAKRDLERRRQENQKRLEEEARKAKQKQASASTQKTLARTQAVANLRQTSEEPERRLDFKTSVGTKPVLVKTAVKRAFQPEATEDQQQYRQAPTKPGAPAYQQDAAKKRRTGEYDERPYGMAPPIRQSVAKKVQRTLAPWKRGPQLIGKKGIMPKSTMPHGYAQASSSTIPSMLRPPTKSGAPMPQVESVKISKENIRFANDTAPGPSASSSSTPSAFKTPGSKSSSKIHMLKTPAGAKDSPIYQNGELIDLPDIPTDSDEDDDDYPPKDSFHVPHWAESPVLRELLEGQQELDPEAIFGPMARLDMDAIFKNGTDRQAQRFRARTSSANWSGADRLTPDEIAADMEARRKMIEQGGWKYQPPQ